MDDLVVREASQDDEVARQEIIQCATRELRVTYRPRDGGGQCASTPSGALVALRSGLVLGTAEYVLRDDHLYVQGLAVHPNCRGQGVGRALICVAEEIARKTNRDMVALRVIEETGNVAIFERWGFKVSSRAISAGYVSPSGNAVTHAEMERTIA